MIGEALSDLEKYGKTNQPQPTPVVVVSQNGGELAVAGGYVAPLARPLATFVAVLLFTGFMLAQREDIRNRLIRLLGADDLQQTTAALDDAGRRVGRMLLAQLALNACFAALAGAALWLIGLPSPFLWGVIGGVLRFVPYIGPIIGASLPLLLAFIVDANWSSLLWTGGLFLALEALFGNVVEPLLVGRSSGLSPVAVLVSATVWAFLWGPIGLVLSTPLTIVLVVLGRHVSRLEFLDILLGDRPALAPDEVFYQRMLAGDPLEARLQAREFLRVRALATYYDSVALPALRRAHLDIMRGLVANDRLATLIAATRKLVDKVGEDVEKRANARRWRVHPPADEDLKPDKPAARVTLTPDVVAPNWRGSQAIAVLYSDNPLDEPAALMLRQVMQRHGLGARAARLEDVRDATEKDAAGVALVCLSFFEPMSAQHLRAASRAVRRRAPGARILLCIWQETDESLLRVLRRRLRVDGIVTTMSDAIEALDSMLPRVEQSVGPEVAGRPTGVVPGRGAASSNVRMRSDVKRVTKAPTSGTRRSTQ